MLNEEVLPHQDELFTHITESVTDKNIDISNTGATEKASHEGDQINLDPNLSLTRSFKKTPELPPNPISFDKTPDIPIDYDQNNKRQDTNYFIPEIEDIDALTLCHSLHIRTQSEKVFKTNAKPRLNNLTR